jgi:hypothetical protein
MRRFAALAAVAAVASFTPAAPATATEVALGVRGGITVYGDLGACATLSAPGALTGSFTASGALHWLARSTRPVGSPYVEPVAGATPVVTTSGSWSGCLGGYPRLDAGEVVYTLTATGPGGDFVEVLRCGVHWGYVNCS